MLPCLVPRLAPDAVQVECVGFPRVGGEPLATWDACFHVHVSARGSVRYCPTWRHGWHLTQYRRPGMLPELDAREPQVGGAALLPPLPVLLPALEGRGPKRS